jgi:hypothetical protein
VAAALLCEHAFHQRGSLFSRLVVAPFLCKTTTLDERKVRGQVVGLLAATFVGQRVPEALYVSLIATALVGQRLPNALFDSSIVQRFRTCCGSRETLLLCQRGTFQAFLLVSQACKSGLM